MANTYKKTMKELTGIRDDWYMLPNNRVSASTAHPSYNLAYQNNYYKVPFWKFLIEYAGEKLDIWKKKDGVIVVDADGDPKLDAIKVITQIWKIAAYLVTLWKFRNDPGT